MSESRFIDRSVNLRPLELSSLPMCAEAIGLLLMFQFITKLRDRASKRLDSCDVTIAKLKEFSF